jgi:hypothetical protein
MNVVQMNEVGQQWPPVFRSPWLGAKNTKCIKCECTRVALLYVPKGIKVMVSQHVISMPDEGFVCHCGMCGFQWIAIMSDRPSGYRPIEVSRDKLEEWANDLSLHGVGDIETANEILELVKADKDEEAKQKSERA